MAIDPNIPLQAGANVSQLDVLGTLGKVQSLQNAQLQNKLGTVDLGAKEQSLANTRMQAFGGMVATALSLLDDRTPETREATAPRFVQGLQNSIEHGMAAGLYTPKEAQALLDGIARTPSLAELVADSKRYALLGIDRNAALSRVAGAGENMTDGQSVFPGVRRDPMFGGGFTPSGPAIPQYPSRSELNTDATIGTNPKTGAPITGPRALVTPPSLGGPAVSPVLGTGRLPQPLLNPNNQPPPVTGVRETTPGPAQQAQLAATGGQSAAAFQRYSDEGQAAQQQDAILANMLNEAEQFGTGFGQDKIKQFKAFIQRFGEPLGVTLGTTPESLAANQSFDKLAAQIANAQGAGSDARLAVNQAANPSSTLSPDGIRLIVNQLRGNADYLRARQKLAAAYPDKTDREGFEANVATKLDPRAFQYARLSPEQRATYFTHIKSEADRRSFKAAYAFAEQNGLLNGGR